MEPVVQNDDIKSVALAPTYKYDYLIRRTGGGAARRLCHVAPASRAHRDVPADPVLRRVSVVCLGPIHVQARLHPSHGQRWLSQWGPGAVPRKGLPDRFGPERLPPLHSRRRLLPRLKRHATPLAALL